MVAMSSLMYAKANVESAEAEIITAQADMKKAKVQMEEAERKMSRSVALFKQQFISREELDTNALNRPCRLGITSHWIQPRADTNPKLAPQRVEVGDGRTGRVKRNAVPLPRSLV